MPSSSFKRASLSSGNSSLTVAVSAFTPPSNGFSSSVTTDSAGFTPPSNGFSSSVTTDSTGLTPPSNGFSSIVGTFSSDLDVITSWEISSSLSVCVMFPVFSSTIYTVVTFTFFPFSLWTTSTLSFAATFTTVSVASFNSGVPTRCITSPVSGFTVYVVVVVLLPVFPGTVIFSCPFSRVVSFTYLTGDWIVSTSTLSFNPFSLNVAFVVFSVIFPLSGSTL